MPLVVPLVKVIDVGVNVPPPELSDGVITTEPVIAPLAATVKLLDAVPTKPLVGPVSV